jgi:hypothetical protein
MKRRIATVTNMSCSLVLAGLVLVATGCTATGTADSGASASARGQCSRATLQKLADTYIEAQTAGNTRLLPFAKGASYAENDKALDVAKSVLTEAIKVDFTRSLHDTTQCATFTELVAATHAHPYVIYTRIEATRNGQVSKMESVVADAGDWVFGATEYLGFTKAENWNEIPADKRDTREAIQAAADAYLNNWGNPDLPVPHGTPCARLEGRMYTGTRNPAGMNCRMGAFPQRLNVSNRRYVIDETLGAVAIFHHFPWLDAGLPPEHPGTPAGHMFRVEGGMNRYIHESTVCTTLNCSRGRPGGGGGGGPGPGGATAPAPGAGPAPAPAAAPTPPAGT